MSDISKKWNDSLRSALKYFCPNQAILSETGLIKDGPSTLEQVTLGKIDLSTPCQFVLLTAPSAAGKGTIGRILEANGIGRVHRTTTRLPRAGEAEGDYHFVSQEEYDKMLVANEFLCPTDFTTSADSCAGIERKVFADAISSGHPFYIDSGSGTAIKIKYEPEMSAVRFFVVFILPPTFEELVRRMEERGVMDKDIMSKRLLIAADHLAQTVFHTDLFVVNDDANRAASQILKLFG